VKDKNNYHRLKWRSDNWTPILNEVGRVEDSGPNNGRKNAFIPTRFSDDASVNNLTAHGDVKLALTKEGIPKIGDAVGMSEVNHRKWLFCQHKVTEVKVGEQVILATHGWRIPEGAAAIATGTAVSYEDVKQKVAVAFNDYTDGADTTFKIISYNHGTKEYFELDLKTHITGTDTEKWAFAPEQNADYTVFWKGNNVGGGVVSFKGVNMTHGDIKIGDSEGLASAKDTAGNIKNNLEFVVHDNTLGTDKGTWIKRILDGEQVTPTNRPRWPRFDKAEATLLLKGDLIESTYETRICYDKLSEDSNQVHKKRTINGNVKPGAWVDCTEGLNCDPINPATNSPWSIQ
jgi:hypothetical protein